MYSRTMLAVQAVQALIIAVVNQKGGVGKTTLVLALAALLADSARRFSLSTSTRREARPRRLGCGAHVSR